MLLWISFFRHEVACQQKEDSSIATDIEDTEKSISDLQPIFIFYSSIIWGQYDKLIIEISNCWIGIIIKYENIFYNKI